MALKNVSICRSGPELQRLKALFEDPLNTGQSDHTCGICLESVDEAQREFGVIRRIHKGDEVGKSSACRHLFHFVCIERWVNENPTCPTCKTAVAVIGIYKPTKHPDILKYKNPLRVKIKTPVAEPETLDFRNGWQEGILRAYERINEHSAYHETPCQCCGQRINRNVGQAYSCLGCSHWVHIRCTGPASPMGPANGYDRLCFRCIRLKINRLITHIAGFLQCIFCRQTASDPVVLHPCNHRACFDCATLNMSLLPNQGPCRLCNLPIRNFFRCEVSRKMHETLLEYYANNPTHPGAQIPGYTQNRADQNTHLPSPQNLNPEDTRRNTDIINRLRERTRIVAFQLGAGNRDPGGSNVVIHDDVMYVSDSEE